MPKPKIPPFLAIGLLAVVLVTAAALAITNKAAPPRSLASDGVPSAQTDDARALVASVAKHILVKTDGIPSVATVQDPDLLRTQNPVFYKDAQKGDRLLVWPDKVVLYSPSRDVLVAVAMMNLPELIAKKIPAPQATSTAPTAPAKEAASIEVRNGSGKVGLAKALSQKLAAAGLSVLSPRDAKAVIASTIIVKASGKELPETLKKLQSLTGASIAELPAGEAKLKGDFLVIVGADYKPE